jgi:glutamine cyclotransferase
VLLQRLSLCALLAILPPAAAALEQYGYRVTGRKPLPRDHFVQGLEISDGRLYLSSGGYGDSRLLRYRFDDGTLESSRPLHPRLFAEGLTLLGDRLYQFTWRAGIVLVYDRAKLEPLEWFAIPGEGWGATHDGSELIYSDGSDKLHFLSPRTRRITRSLAVTENGSPLLRLNELEWVEGKIWANVWLTDRIVIIAPDSGAVTAAVDLQGLLPAGERQQDTDVLNGIARDPADGSVWVTGKRWPWLYRIELVPAGPGPAEPAAPSESARESR